jgi:hypothetical protein
MKVLTPRDRWSVCARSLGLKPVDVEIAGRQLRGNTRHNLSPVGLGQLHRRRHTHLHPVCVHVHLPHA